jgi:predicted small secreted protein
MGKKIILFILIVYVLLLCSCNSQRGVTEKIEIGMPFDEVNDVLSDDQILLHCNYLFLKSEDKNTVIKFDKATYTVNQIKTFKPISFERSSAEKICEGMDVFEVVELIGIPTRSSYSGLSAMDYESVDGCLFRIVWNGEMRVSETIWVD